MKLSQATLLPTIICAAYIVQLAIVLHTAYHGIPAPDIRLNYLPGTTPMVQWQTQAPIRLSQPEVIASHVVWPAFALLGLVESVALFFFYRHTVRNGIDAATRNAIVGASAVMGLASLVLPASTSADAYAYIGYGLAPTLHDSFDTTKFAIPPAFAIISNMYGKPLTPNVYGAGFYALMSFVRLFRAPLAVDLYALRILGGIAFGLVVWLLRRRLPAPAIATLALCPALYFEWVLNSHNDVYPVLLTVVALTLMPKRAALAVVAICCATLFKVAVLAVGVTAVALRENVTQRIGIAAIAIVLSVLAVVALDGRSFVGAVVPHLSDTTAEQLPPSLRVARPVHPVKHAYKVRIVLYLAIVAIVGIAVFRRRATAGNAFVFTALAPAGYAWYFTWGLAYAALTPDSFAFIPIVLSAVESFVELEPHGLLPLNLVDWGFALSLIAIFAVLRRYRPVANEAV